MDTHSVVDSFLAEAVQLDVVVVGVLARHHTRAGVLHVTVEFVLTPRLSHMKHMREICLFI